MTQQTVPSLAEISFGQSDRYARTVTEDDIALFADVSGDDNPVHFDEDWAAAATPFKGRIAHGMLSASYVSTVIGTLLPGPGSIYMGQTLRFRAPVRIGDTVRATVTVREIDAERRRLTLDTVCRVGETTVIDGEALVMIPRPVRTAA